MSQGPSEEDLSNKKGSMKKVTTKTVEEFDPAAIQAMECLYTDNDGDLKKIEDVTGMTFKPGATCKDKTDFAKKILSGILCLD
jgi:hypothetical protein